MNYKSIAKSVLKAIKDAGKPVTLTKSNDTGTDVISSGFAIEDVLKQKNAEGAIINAGDKSFMCVGIDKPEIGDRLTAGSTTFAVLNSWDISPGDIVLYYEVHARG